MTTKIYTSLALAGMIALAGCGGGTVSVNAPQGTPQPPAPSAVVLAIDFNAGSDGWSGGVADYYDTSIPTEVKFEQKALPSPLSGKALYMVSHNNSDDVFTYVKKQFGGLVPNTKYAVDVEIRYTSAAATGCVGVGGAEGDSVYLTAAVSAAEPILVKLDDGRYRLNIDRGDQAQGGTAGRVLGLIGNDALKCDNSVYASSVRKTASPITVQADAAGKVWLVMGTDSAFESTSALYLQSATFSAKPL